MNTFLFLQTAPPADKATTADEYYSSRELNIRYLLMDELNVRINHRGNYEQNRSDFYNRPVTNKRHARSKKYVGDWKSIPPYKTSLTPRQQLLDNKK